MHAWLGIELRHLAALHAVLEEQSFVRAGRRLGYTQSAISNQIAALERLVGTRLVERARGGSSIALTPTGRVLFEHASALMARLQAARSDIAAAGPELSPVLRLGYVPSVGPTLLPPLVHAFAARAPDVRLELVPGDAQHLSERLDAADVLDAALLPTAASGDAFGSVLLAEDPFVLVGPPGEALPLASGLAALPLLAGDPCPVQAEHEAELPSSHGRLVRLDDAPTVVALVAAGCAYGLLPGSAVGSAAVTVHELGGRRRQVHLVWRQDRCEREVLRRLVDSARESFGEHARRHAA